MKTAQNASRNKLKMQSSANQLNINAKLDNLNIKRKFGFSSFGGSAFHTKKSDGINSLLNYSSSSFAETGNEVSMWRAVITQAIIDAVSNSKRGEKIKAKNSALAWFDINNENFLCVCKFAEMSPDYVLKKSLKAIESCHLWKRDMKYIVDSPSKDSKKCYYKTSYQREQEDFSRYEDAWS